jgi:hypothetical protein
MASNPLGKIPIKNVESVGHFEWRTDSGSPSPGGKSGDRVEVYTGNVVVEYQEPDSDQVGQLTFFTFLPFPGNVVRTYGDESMPTPRLIYTALVTPVGINGHASEWLASVDHWNVEFLKGGADPFTKHPGKNLLYPALNFQLAVLNTNIIRVGYQVTLVTSASLAVDFASLNGTDIPNGDNVSPSP